MPKPFKLHSTRSLPADADIVDRDGKPHVRLKDRGRAIFCPLTKDGRGYLRPSKCWYFKYRDANGTVKRIKGFADLKATEQLAAETERRASRTRVGIIDPGEEHARRPLAEYLKDYADALEAKGDSMEHVRKTTARTAALFAGSGFVFPNDIDAAKVARWLNSIRRDGPRVDLPTNESFRPSEVAELLGISGTAVAVAVKRLNLLVTGNGKARRLPRTSVEVLVQNRLKGTGPATINHYIRAVRGFCRWLVRTNRIGSNPLESLTLVNEAVDVRRSRRELTSDELRRLFDAAQSSGRVFRGLTGGDRYTLYLLAVGTGFRAAALANLTPGDFDFDRATVTLPARFNKSRRQKVQPLPTDVSAALRSYMTGKPTAVPIWGGTWHSGGRTADMIRTDLEAAGIAYATDGPDGPEYADFHSLRHSFLTLGGRSGIDLRTLQELAGHSTPLLTARYSHRRLHDLVGAIEKLPAFVPASQAGTPAEASPLRNSHIEDPTGVPQGVPTGYAEPHQSAPMYTFGIVGEASRCSPQTPEKVEVDASQHRAAPTRTIGPAGIRTLNQGIMSPLL